MIEVKLNWWQKRSLRKYRKELSENYQPIKIFVSDYIEFKEKNFKIVVANSNIKCFFKNNGHYYGVKKGQLVVVFKEPIEGAEMIYPDNITYEQLCEKLGVMHER